MNADSLVGQQLGPFTILDEVGRGTGPDNGDVFVVPSGGGVAQQLSVDGATYDWRLAWLA